MIITKHTQQCDYNNREVQLENVRLRGALC